MLKISLILSVFFCLFSEPSIVFIHLGQSLPDYLPTAVNQARLFNNNCPIYLIANEEALKNLPEELTSAHPIFISAESLPSETKHERFRRFTRLDKQSRGGFWMFATERFFYLYELMKRDKLVDVFHLESDNMLYSNLSKLIPLFQKYYRGKMGATFDNDTRCIAGLIYVSSLFPLDQFLEFVVNEARSPKNDMEFLAAFKEVDGGAYIDSFPIVAPLYVQDHELVSAHHHRVKNPEVFSNHFDSFQSVFDAAALGQYLGGEDPRNGSKGPGFINESCVFNPSLFQFDWIEDKEGRLVPFISYNQEQWPIINLHIHCKNLKLFHSRRSL